MLGASVKITDLERIGEGHYWFVMEAADGRRIGIGTHIIDYHPRPRGEIPKGYDRRPIN